MMSTHVSRAELQSELDMVRRSPQDKGVLELIVRRPGENRRETVEEAELDLVQGLVGDNWYTRGSASTTDGAANPDMQITIMNARLIALVAQEKERWPLAGDQLYVDLDLGVENLPPGARLCIGSVILEVTDVPHTGCKKFMDRFGRDAVKFVNSPEGKKLRLRGLNARIIQSGLIRVGQTVRKCR